MSITTKQMSRRSMFRRFSDCTNVHLRFILHARKDTTLGLVRYSRVRFGVFFFFSSRRRHTRSLCDWSSDVCSSDLGRRKDRRWSSSWSPEQIAHRLPLDFPDDPSMRISHEAIYQSLYVQGRGALRSEEHTSELQSHSDLVCRLLLEKKKHKMQ